MTERRIHLSTDLAGGGGATGDSRSIESIVDVVASDWELEESRGSMMGLNRSG
jgi:hypothetical protein